MAAATWLLSDCDTILSVEINCVIRRYSEAIGNFNNVNGEGNRDDILDISPSKCERGYECFDRETGT